MIKKSEVLILIGSKSDLDVISKTTKLLDEFGITYDLKVASAHRSPNLVREFTEGARDSGVKVVIAAAGFAAHLAGAAAAHTDLPVIGVPLPASSLGGLDSLLSIAQMPSGVPVATMSIGDAGAANAAIFALEILSINDDKRSEVLKKYREDMLKKAEASN